MPRLKHHRTVFFYPSPRVLTQSTTNFTSSTNKVNLRIEANTSTLYEGPITSGPRNITGFDGTGPVTYICDGAGAKPNPPPPGNTPTDALDAAAKIRGFTYDASFDGEFNDFDFTRIATSSRYTDNTSFHYWGSLVNYQVSIFGEGLTISGCNQEVNAGDEVLWAFISELDTENSNSVLFLKLTPTAVTVKKGKGTTVTVTDGRSGVAVQNASVAGVETDANGKATLYFFQTGFYQHKAHKTGEVRSNVMNITVTN